MKKFSKILKVRNYNVFRCIYSQTGIWPKEPDCEMRKNLEKYWMTEIKNRPNNNASAEKYYVLSMFPYPSGKLHMGHVRVYAISDSIAWFQRLQGKNVIHPMGWDAFGLPAENAAIERKEKPDVWTKNNIKTMKKQLMDLGITFDWDRELATCDPKYYKWTQYLFLKLFEKGLLYRREAIVNWDPVDKTVLADEQVDENGFSWRSGAKVEKKKLKQWFIRSTVYSKDLYDRLSLPEMKQWRDVVKLQRHWIGACTGFTLDLKLSFDGNEISDKLSVWVNKLWLLDQAKFATISPDHFLNCDQYRQNDRLSLEAINPITHEKIPILISPTCDHPESTNSKLGFPTSNLEDNLLANKFGLKFSSTIKDEIDFDVKNLNNAMYNHLQKEGVFIYPASRKLRDWLISRQRYWGTPIPIIRCPNCGEVPVPIKALPVILPQIDSLSKTEGISPLEKATDWMNTKCPKCEHDARRETDTMDTFVDSSWYYLRYLDVHNESELMGSEKKELMPVDIYIGGKEHAIMHLYYARFINQFCHSIGLVKNPEPFSALLAQGMVLGQTYKSGTTGKYLKPDEVEAKDKDVIEKSTGQSVIIEWDKMSKSKHNGVDPQDVLNEHGVDALRLFILADVAPNTPRKWNSERFDDLIKFMRKLWVTVSEYRDYKNGVFKVKDEITPDELIKHEQFLFDTRNYYLKGATSQFIFKNQISIAISKMQALSSSLRSVPKNLWCGNPEFERTLAVLLIALVPVLPHFTSELWEGFRSMAEPNVSYDITKKLMEQKWPKVDQHYNLELKVKVNNDDKAIIKIPRFKLDILNEKEALDLAYNEKGLIKALQGKEILEVVHEHYLGLEYIIKITARKLKVEKN